MPQLRQARRYQTFSQLLDQCGLEPMEYSTWANGYLADKDAIPVTCALCGTQHTTNPLNMRNALAMRKSKTTCPTCHSAARDAAQAARDAARARPETPRAERAARAEVLRQRIDETRAKLARLLEERAALVATLQDERSELPDER